MKDGKWQMAVRENYRKYHEIIFLIIYIIKNSSFSYSYGSTTNCHLSSVIFVSCVIDRLSKRKGCIFLQNAPLFFVHPMRIELISSEPESGILSIELRVHFLVFRVQKYK